MLGAEDLGGCGGRPHRRRGSRPGLGTARGPACRASPGGPAASSGCSPATAPRTARRRRQWPRCWRRGGGRARPWCATCRATPPRRPSRPSARRISPSWSSPPTCGPAPPAPVSRPCSPSTPARSGWWFAARPRAGSTPTRPRWPLVCRCSPRCGRSRAWPRRWSAAQPRADPAARSPRPPALCSPSFGRACRAGVRRDRPRRPGSAHAWLLPAGGDEPRCRRAPRSAPSPAASPPTSMCSRRCGCCARSSSAPGRSTSCCATPHHRCPGHRRRPRSGSTAARAWSRTGVRFPDEAAVRRLAQRLALAAGRRLDDASPYVDAWLRRRRGPAARRPRRRSPPTAPACPCGSCGPPRTTWRRCARSAPSTRRARPCCARCWRPASRSSSPAAPAPARPRSSRAARAVDPGERIVSSRTRRSFARGTRTSSGWSPGRPTSRAPAGSSLRDLVRQALRMRPDRLVVGEVRGAEVCDLLAALNTGHDGGAGTVHANSAGEVPARLEALAAPAGCPARPCTASSPPLSRWCSTCAGSAPAPGCCDVVGVPTRTSEGVAVGSTRGAALAAGPADATPLGAAVRRPRGAGTVVNAAACAALRRRRRRAAAWRSAAGAPTGSRAALAVAGAPRRPCADSRGPRHRLCSVGSPGCCSPGRAEPWRARSWPRSATAPRARLDAAGAAAAARQLADALPRSPRSCGRAAHPAAALAGVRADGPLARDILLLRPPPHGSATTSPPPLRRGRPRPRIGPDVERIAVAWRSRSGTGSRSPSCWARVAADIRWRVRFGADRPGPARRAAGHRPRAHRVARCSGSASASWSAPTRSPCSRGGVLGQMLLVIGVTLVAAGQPGASTSSARRCRDDRPRRSALTARSRVAPRCSSPRGPAARPVAGAHRPPPPAQIERVAPPGRSRLWLAAGARRRRLIGWAVAGAAAGSCSARSPAAVARCSLRRAALAPPPTPSRTATSPRWELLAVCLEAVCPSRPRCQAAAEPLGGSTGAQLRRVSGLLELGADPVHAWLAAGTCPRSRRSLAQRAAPPAPARPSPRWREPRAGAPRRPARLRAGTGGARRGARSPARSDSASCPAFLVLGIAPVVIGLAGEALAQW